MADLTVKRNDTWPPVEAVISDADGPVDLTDATVKILLKQTGGDTPVTREGTCDVDSDQETNPGVVTYTWAAAADADLGDTGVAGTYTFEFEVTFAGGGVETFPNDAYLTLEIKEDLG